MQKNYFISSSHAQASTHTGLGQRTATVHELFVRTRF